MKYRRLLYLFAFMTFYSTSNNEVATVQKIFTDDTPVEIDGIIVSRRGLIDQISEILEGAVSVTEDILNTLLLPIKQLIKLDQKAILDNPHQNDEARVRLGGPICDEELSFREARFPVVKDAQEQFLETSLDDEDVLEIAFVASGGGVRAQIYSLGACFGADKMGLLDAVMCISALSGSTWFLSSWISGGLPISEYKEQALDEVCRGIDIDNIEDFGPMFDALFVKFAFNQHINVVDLYGALLANNFLDGLEKQQNMVYLSDQVSMMNGGSFPLPICTAILGERDYENYWFEFTPFEVGSRWLGAYIPAWSFGRKFKRGSSTVNAPEMSSGFLLGIYGSAFAASFEEMYERSFKYIELPKWLNDVPLADSLFASLKEFFRQATVCTDFGDIRFAWGQVFNYVYKMRECSFRGERNLKLVDAGCHMNNPIFVTYRKPPYGSAPDVIFVFDSGGKIGIDELNLEATYAEENNLPFPDIDKKDATEKVLTVFGDPSDLENPLVLYMPRIVDHQLLALHKENSPLSDYPKRLYDLDIEEEISSGFARTVNFEYSREQAELISDLAEFNVRAVEKEIKELLKKRISAKRLQRNKS